MNEQELDTSEYSEEQFQKDRNTLRSLRPLIHSIWITNNNVIPNWNEQPLIDLLSNI